MHNEDMARKLNEPATKGDLVELKNDMMSAVKGDLLPIKNDVAALKGDMSIVKGDIAGLKGNIKQIAIQMLTLDAKQTARTEALGKTFQLAYSTLMGRMDAFMSNTLKVQTDQAFHTHRLDVHEQDIKMIKSHIGLDPRGR